MNVRIKPQRPAWMAVVARYQVPDTWKGVVQVCNSFAPFVATWILMYLSLGVSYALTLALSLPAVGFLIRIFIIQHDCGHGSFLKSKRINDLIGCVAGVLTLTPYFHWRKSHAIHHATASDLEQRGIGDIWTLTVKEYLQRSKWGRFKYRLYRNPLVLFGVGPTLQLTILQRFPPNRVFLWNKERASIWLTNLILIGLYVLLGELMGWKAFIMVQAPIVVLAASLGTWLFYVQHQFEGTYWSPKEGWDYTLAALKGSSYYKLPRIMQWFTGNIGFHHIHHLSHRIPNYHLQRCHDENPIFQKAFVLTLWASFKTAVLTLYDEEKQKLVSFRHLKTLRQPDASNA